MENIPILGMNREANEIRPSLIIGPDIKNKYPHYIELGWLRQYVPSASDKFYYLIVGNADSPTHIWQGGENYYRAIFTCVYDFEHSKQPEPYELTLALLKMLDHDGTITNAREWCLEGWRLESEPSPEQIAAALLMEARGVNTPEGQQYLREVAFKILHTLHKEPYGA